MMSATLKNLGIVLGLLVAALILLNVSFLMPFLTTEEPVQFASIPDESPEGTIADDVVIKDTLSEIKAITPGQSDIHIFPDDRNIRNPFYWPEEKKKQVVIKKEIVAPVETLQPERLTPQLSMVIVGNQRRQAVLDDVFVSEGDTIYGYLVKRIGAEEVVLADEYGELNIRLGVTDQNAEQPQVPPGLIER